MLVSIIIPVFNGELFLNETLQSVLQQTHVELDIIVVDDGSTDNTRRIAEQFALSDLRIRVISQSNAGLAGARNTGIRNISPDAKFVHFLDGDDLIASTFMEAMLKELDDNPAAIGAHCLPSYIDKFGNSFQDTRLEDVLMNRQPLIGVTPLSHENSTTFFDIVLRNCMVVGSQILRRQIVELVGEFDQNLQTHEDWDYWIRASRHGSFIRSADRLMTYRRTGTSMSDNLEEMANGSEAVFEKAEQSPENSTQQLALIDLAKPVGAYKRRIAWTKYCMSKKLYVQAAKHLWHAAVLNFDCLKVNRKYRRVTAPEVATENPPRPILF